MPACRQTGLPTIKLLRFLIQKKNFAPFVAWWLTAKPQRAQRRLCANQHQQIAGNFPAQGGCLNACLPADRPANYSVVEIPDSKKELCPFVAWWLTAKPLRAQRRFSANLNQQIAFLRH
jgi:hypothetical protein